MEQQWNHYATKYSANAKDVEPQWNHYVTKYSANAKDAEQQWNQCTGLNWKLVQYNIVQNTRAIVRNHSAWRNWWNQTKSFYNDMLYTKVAAEPEAICLN